MKSNLILLSALIISLTFGITRADNVVKLDSLVRHSSSHYSINLILENQDTLAGFQIPLTFIGNGLSTTIDSASYTNCTLSGLSIQKFKIDSTGHSIYIFGVCGNDSTSLILPNNYHVCKIYFNCILEDSTGTIIIHNSPWIIGINRVSFKVWNINAVEAPSRFETIPLNICQFGQ